MFVRTADDIPDLPSHPIALRIGGTRRLPDGSMATVDNWAIPNETAIEFRLNGQAVAVMMASPSDLEDFALGFALTERLIPDLQSVQRLTTETTPQGIILSLETAKSDFATALKARRRGLEGRSGCGLCGVRTLGEAMRSVSKVTTRQHVTAAAIHRALENLESEQRLNQMTRAVHAAAWADLDGTIRAVREDVGRHNALDKLAGWLAQSAVDPATGFCVITSRCSFEMVQKAAAMNIATLVAISAPTALALSLAEEAGMTLAAIARADSHILFTTRPTA